MSATLLTADDLDRLPTLAHVTTLRRLQTQPARTVAVAHARAFRKVVREYSETTTLHALRQGGAYQ